MPRPTSKTPEVPQRPSPTFRGPRHLRTSSSDSDPLHQRPIIDKSPRLGDRRSPRGAQSDPLNQKKLGTRITDLETQLVQAQHELKSLKHQLGSAERAKKQAQEELHKKGAKKPTVTKRVQGREKPQTAEETQEKNSRDKPEEEVREEINQETDVFEVPVEKMLVEPVVAEMSNCSLEDGKGTKSLDSTVSELEKPSECNELASKTEALDQLRAKMEEKEKEMQVVVEDNETLKKQLDEAKAQITAAQSKEEDMASKLDQLGQELEASKVNAAQLKEQLLSVAEEKESLETEMKKMKVQTEQWRKAADAAAAVLAGGPADVNGRISGRCASMDNHFNGIFEPPINAYGGYLGSPGDGNDGDDGFGGGKKKGNSGIRMLGDLWKKKGGQK